MKNQSERLFAIRVQIPKQCDWVNWVLFTRHRSSFKVSSFIPSKPHSKQQILTGVESTSVQPPQVFSSAVFFSPPHKEERRRAQGYVCLNHEVFAAAARRAPAPAAGPLLRWLRNSRMGEGDGELMPKTNFVKHIGLFFHPEHFKKVVFCRIV